MSEPTKPAAPRAKPAGKAAEPPLAPPPADPGYTRRQLLQTLGAAGAATAIGVALLDRDDGVRRRKLLTIRDHAVDPATLAADLAIMRGADAATNARRAIAALGGIEKFVRRGETVVIKPNVGWNRTPEQAANTNPEVVAELVRLVRGAGAGRVWVTDVPVNDAERCFHRSGIRAAAEAAGATVLLPGANDFRDVEIGGDTLRSGQVFYPFVEADRVINVPCVKHHGLTRATLSMKNWYGVLGGQRVLLHQDIHRSIVDLARMVKPTLTVLDATRALTANGPSGGSLDDVRRLDTVAASVDEVALDAFGAGLLDLRPDELEFVARGERAGLGVADYRSLRLIEEGA